MPPVDRRQGPRSEYFARSHSHAVSRVLHDSAGGDRFITTVPPENSQNSISLLGGAAMKTRFLATSLMVVLLAMSLGGVARADKLAGFSDITMANDAIASLRYGG